MNQLPTFGGLVRAIKRMPKHQRWFVLLAIIAAAAFATPLFALLVVLALLGGIVVLYQR